MLKNIIGATRGHIDRPSVDAGAVQGGRAPAAPGAGAEIAQAWAKVAPAAPLRAPDHRGSPMKRPLIRLLALAPLLWLCTASHAQTRAEPGLQRVVAYFLDVFYVRHAMNQSLEQGAADEPELRALIGGAFAQFDPDALAGRIADGLAPSLPAEDARACAAFVDSADGAALRGASRKAGVPDRLVAELEALPQAQQQAVIAFLSSDCSKRVQAFMVSAQGKQITGDYGKYLTCDYIARNDAAKLKILKQHGQCPQH